MAPPPVSGGREQIGQGPEKERRLDAVSFAIVQDFLSCRLVHLMFHFSRLMPVALSNRPKDRA